MLNYNKKKEVWLKAWSFLICSLSIMLLSLFFTPEISAQVEDDVPDAVLPMSGSGANLLTGELEDTIPLVSIGHGSGTLSHSIKTLGYDSFATTSLARISISEFPTGGQYSYNVILPGAQKIRFEANAKPPTNATIFSEYIKQGNSLSFSNGTYTFKSSFGDIALFVDQDPNNPRATTITAADGVIWSFDYIGSDLSSVKNNLGYQLKFQNPASSSEVRAVNNSNQYCNPVATTCSLASHWAKGTGGAGSTSFVDAANRTYSVNQTGSSSNGDQTLSFPGGTAVSKSHYLAGKLWKTDRYGVVTLFTTSENDMGTPNNDNDDLRTVNSALAGGGQTTTVSRKKGNLIVSSTDVLGQTTAYTYTADNQVETILFPRGDSIEFSYDVRGNVTEVRRKSVPGSGSFADLVTSATYPSSCTSSNAKYCNKPTTTTDQFGNVTSYTYHAESGNIDVITHPSDGTNGSHTTDFDWIQVSAKVKNSAGSLVNSAPVWKLDQVTRYTGTNKEIKVWYSYNVNRNLVPSWRKVSAGGITHTTSYYFDLYGNLLYTTGPMSGTYDRVAVHYDKLRRVIGQIGIDPDGSGPQLRSAKRINYNLLGKVDNVETGTTSNYTLSALNSMSVLRKRQNTRNGDGRLLQTKLQSGSTTYSRVDYSYDSQSRRICSALRMNPTTLSGPYFDACTLGSPGAFGSDRITKREYDTASRVKKLYKALGTPEESYEEASYYNYGPVRYLYDANGNQTRYTYDKFNRLRRTDYPNPSTGSYNTSDYEIFYYDSLGRNYRTRQRDGQHIYRTFDNLGRIDFLNAPGTSEDTTFGYDITGRMTSAVKSGSSLVYAYDNRGRLQSETSSLGTVSYQYDNYDRRKQMNYPGSDNFYVTYEYQAISGLKFIREKGSASLAQFNYDTQGRRQSVILGASATKSYNYDAISRLQSLSNDLGGTSMDQTLTFTYNPSGQIATMVNSNTAYDPVAASLDKDFIYNGLNQILSSGNMTYQYDAAGNLTSGEGESYGYDYANRLTSVNGSKSGSLTYDAASRLTTVSSGGATSSFLYDGHNMIAEYQGSSLNKRYVHGPGMDAPIAEYTGTNLSSKIFMITDSRGSITGHANMSGTSVATNSYDSYGKPSSNNSGRFQYTGQVWLEELGLYYYKARFYSPNLRRFLNADPIRYGAGMNMYAYVSGDPINLTDPWGLDEDECDPETDETCKKKEETEQPEDEVVAWGTRVYYGGGIGVGLPGGVSVGGVILGGTIGDEIVVTDEIEVEKEEKEEKENNECQTIAVPNWGEMEIPNGWNLLPGGTGPQAGYHYMVDPSGEVHSTPVHAFSSIEAYNSWVRGATWTAAGATTTAVGGAVSGNAPVGFAGLAVDLILLPQAIVALQGPVISIPSHSCYNHN